MLLVALILALSASNSPANSGDGALAGKVTYSLSSSEGALVGSALALVGQADPALGNTITQMTGPGGYVKIVNSPSGSHSDSNTLGVNLRNNSTPEKAAAAIVHEATHILHHLGGVLPDTPKNRACAEAEANSAVAGMLDSLSCEADPAGSMPCAAWEKASKNLKKSSAACANLGGPTFGVPSGPPTCGCSG